MTSGLKRFSLFLLVCALCCRCVQSSSSEKNLHFTIKGKLENHDSQSHVYLSASSGNEFVPFDTAEVSRDGEFLFEGDITAADLYRISFSDEDGFVIVIDAPRIEIYADAKDLKNFRVTGSEESLLMKQLLQAEHEYLDALTALEKKFVLARNAGHNDSLMYFREKYQELRSAYAKERKDFIREHPRSVVASYAAYVMSGEGENEAFVDSVLVVLNREIPQSKYVQRLNERKRDTGLVAVGTLAPEIILPEPDGTPLTLSSLRGKYVLIDFWASWCRPCREENPEMVKLHHQYKGKGFEILGVSLDESREQWIRAVEADGLPWRHVSDLKGAGSEAVQLYNVQLIPMTVFLDKEGKVIALNLRVDDLRKKLEEIFD